MEAAVDRVLNAGWRTADLAGGNGEILGCTAMTDQILKAL